MIYTGDYTAANIYGTSNGFKIKATTTDTDTFLSVKLTVNFNGEEWIHTFEVPFFQNKAELYIENYIHSIITQKFSVPSFFVNDYKINSYDLATVKMEVSEMKATVSVSAHVSTFYMRLGNFVTVSQSALTSGNIYLLPSNQSNYVSENGMLSFTFLSLTLPGTLTVNDGVTSSIKTLPTVTSSKKLHTLTVPVEKIKSGASDSLLLRLNFGSNSYAELGTFNIQDEGIDHNLIAYQNEFGTLSVMELTGELQTDEQYKESVFRHSNNKKVSLTPTKIEIKKMYAINTGYMRDDSKYEMLRSLLKSFNRYIFDSGFKRIILSSAQKIKPFKSDYYLNNETLKFKLSENDDIYYRPF